eukprot:gnl/MRDRNA2_/MRDRNA2_86695_c0_seq10.p1 gnl/MRDRNA2_/MRDRNA2_86695_c0~~gnl/MRDRNA2_/MRDRNA2_86695_c0_seq10.p1  ORF type:complete len:106 (+),score=7.15 gnl/MRDRNA2_/MRDRNA2_86695_c0_seq10:535-852(+)
MDAISQEAIRKSTDFSMQWLTNIAWAYMTVAATKGERFFTEIIESIVLQLVDFWAANLTLLACAFATLRVLHNELLDSIAEEVIANSSEYVLENICCMAWAFATL